MVDKEKYADLVMKIIRGKPRYIQLRYDYVAAELDIPIVEMGDKTEMALIKNVTFGVDERGEVSLRLGIMSNDSVGTLNILNVETAVSLIMDYDVKDVKDLIGKPIKVISDRQRMMWLEPIKIKLGKR